MKTLYYFLVLSIISTGYLFSQREENEIIKEDTVMRVVVATKVDTIIIEEPVITLKEKYENYFYEHVL